MPPKATAPEKKFVVTVSVSQGKHIQLSGNHQIRVVVGPEEFTITGRGATPVYNDTKDFYVAEAPQHVTIQILEPHFFGSPTLKGAVRVPVTAASFPEDGSKVKVCPLSYVSLTSTDGATAGAESEGGAGTARVEGELEIAIVTSLKDKAASLSYRESLGILTMHVTVPHGEQAGVLNTPSPGSGKVHVVEVNYGMQRYITRPKAGAAFDDKLRLWVYGQTKGYRLDVKIMERDANAATQPGGSIVGRCLLTATTFADAACRQGNEMRVGGWIDLQPQTTSSSSDRDHAALESSTVDMSRLVAVQMPAAATAAAAGAAAAAGGGASAGGAAAAPAAAAAGAPPTGAAEAATFNKSGSGVKVFVNFTFTPKAVAERIFFEGLWSHFDSDNDRTLDRIEVAAMMDTLRCNMSDEELDRFIASVDQDRSGKLDHDEVMRLLQSSEFQSSALSASMMQFLIDGREGLARMLSGIGDSVQIVDGSAVRTTATGETDADDMGLLIFDRRSGNMLHEHIPWYIRTALKSMYRSAIGRSLTQTSKVRSMLVNQSRAEGVKMDDPESKAKIAGFIEQYGLDVDEILEPLNSFPHFNAFFYRKLKPTARPIESPDDEKVAVSCADSRMSVFHKMTDATKVWIKGSEFTVEKLLGPRQDLVPLFTNPTLVIARLAPQDYHRVHFPVSGTMGKITPIDGTLMTVNPCAVRGVDGQAVNVYTENVRHVLELKTPEFGTVVMIMVGATMVGSVNVNEQFKQEGAPFRKGDDAGYFAFGGSTTLLLFQPGSIELDADLVDFSTKPIEVLVRVGNRIGAATGNFAESTTAAQSSIDNLRTMFGRFDADGSGMLSRDEAVACVSLLFPNESVTAIIAKIRAYDYDNDGRMSFLEFAALAREVETLPTERTALTERLHRFYERYNRDGIARIPEIVERYNGRDEELFAALVAKYGPEP